MAFVSAFALNPFQENTYIVYDETKECIIIDPGCSNAQEEQVLTDFIEKKGLKPVRLLLTHCHLDHIFGNHFIHQTYGLAPEFHQADLPVFESFLEVCKHYGIPNAKPSPPPKQFIQTNAMLTFGASKMKAILAPGHSPGSLCFYFEEEGFMIAGDVLFRQSIGRTDLPGGDYDTLIQSIQTELMPLPDEVIVFSGHGPQTTIGYERRNNPFLNS